MAASFRPPQDMKMWACVEATPSVPCKQQEKAAEPGNGAQLGLKTKVDVIPPAPPRAPSPDT
jgi:hypothetical protein